MLVNTSSSGDEHFHMLTAEVVGNELALAYRTRTAHVAHNYRSRFGHRVLNNDNGDRGHVYVAGLHLATPT